LQFEFNNELVEGFRIVGFGVLKAMEIEDKEGGGGLSDAAADSTAA